MEAERIRKFGLKIQQLIEGKNLSRDESYAMFKEVLLNQQPDLQQGAFLAALVAKGETTDEIIGAWAAIDELDTIHTSSDLPVPLFENSGTGMDRLKTFNVSSASAIVAAACGVKMGRHGARALTSACGTVDILEAVGIDVECDIETVERSICLAGIGLFNGMSSKVHPGALGRILSQIRFGSTLNIAASLANPCRPTYGLRGVYAEQLMQPVAEIMREIGYERGMVVYGKDVVSGHGMDELSILGETVVCEFLKNETRDYAINPEDVGLRRVSYEEIANLGNIHQEAVRFVQVLAGIEHEACIDFTCLNAGAILYLTDKCASLKRGVEISSDAIEHKLALNKLRQWVSTQDATSGRGTERLEDLIKKLKIF